MDIKEAYNLVDKKNYTEAKSVLTKILKVCEKKRINMIIYPRTQSNS